MKFSPTPIEGVYIVDIQAISDDRGFFARAFCADELRALGLNGDIAQINISQNQARGTLRGMHFQDQPAPEAKFIRCVQGAIYDAVVDMREGSPTHLQHFALELSADNHTALYVPEFFAHGYQALTDHAVALYSASAPYTPGSERGIRYNDPLLGIQWPLEAHSLSDKDASWPLLDGRSAAVSKR